MNKTLKQEFQAIRQRFFPRWDRAGRWRIRHVRDLDGARGRCCPDRTIRITFRGGVRGTALMIHEIAHAVTGDGHGRRWQARMEQAAVTAADAGQADLAGLLRADIAGYNDPLARVSARLVYQEIADAASPDVTFSEVIEFVRRGYGLPRRQFLKRFPRARKVFDEAKRDGARAK